MNRQLIIAEPGRIAYEERPAIGSPGPGEIHLRTRLSGISHGTEMTAYRGTSPFLSWHFNEDRCFVPHDDQTAPFYPFRYAGYDLVGEVVAAAADVRGLEVGDRVFIAVPHQTELLVSAASPGVLRLRPETAAEDAIMVSLATVAFGAVHDAEIKLGDNVAIFGAGMVGQLTAQLARRAGAGTVLIVDPVAGRRQQSEALCGAVAIDPALGHPTRQIRDHLAGRWPDVVIECSGAVKALADAVAAAGVGGSVVAAGFCAEPATDFCFGREFLHNRVTIRASMGVWGCPTRWPLAWDYARKQRIVLDMIEAGQLRLDGYVSLRVDFERAQEAYETIAREPTHTKAVLVYGR